MSQSKLERLGLFTTNQLADVLHICGLKGSEYGLRPVWKSSKFVGQAITATLAHDGKTTESTHQGTSSPIIPPKKNQVLVVSGGESSLSGLEVIVENGWKGGWLVGTVFDGTLQYAESKDALASPFHARDVFRVADSQSASPTLQLEIGAPVRMRSTTVHQDDYVVADSAGTVFISADDVDLVLEVAETIRNRPGLTPLSIKPDKLLGAKSRKATTEDTELVALFEGVDTAGVSDALDKLGIPGQARGLMPLTNYDKVTIGPAFTVRYVPAEQPAGSVGDFIDDVVEGDVVVIDNGARTDCTVWGDIMTQYAGLREIAGTVIDGVCRDVNRAISDNYPLFTVGRWMRTGKDRVQVGGVNEAVGIGGVHVKPRDIVVADANGVVFVPRHRAREVSQLAQDIEKKEASIRESILRGATLAEARQEFGYHLLQRHEE